MTDVRISQHTDEVVHSGVPEVRLSQQTGEVVHGGVPSVNLSQHTLEVVAESPISSASLESALAATASVTSGLRITASLGVAAIGAATLLDASLAFPGNNYVTSAISSQASVTADLDVPLDFTAHVLSEASSSSALNILDNIALDAAIVADASQAVTLTVLSPIEAAVTSVASIAGDATEFNRVDIQSALLVVTGVSGTLKSGGVRLATSLSATSSVVSDFNITGNIALDIDLVGASLVSVGLGIKEPFSASLSAQSSLVSVTKDPEAPELAAALAAVQTVSAPLSLILVPQSLAQCGPVICWDGHRPITYTVHADLPRQSVLVGELCCEEIVLAASLFGGIGSTAVIVADLVVPVPVYTYGAPIMAAPYADVFSCFYDAVQVSESIMWFTGDDPFTRYLLYYRFDVETQSYVDTINIPGVESNVGYGDFYTYDNATHVVTFGVNGYSVIPKSDYTQYVNTLYSPSVVVVDKATPQLGTNYLWVSKYYQSPASNTLERFNLSTMVFDGTTLTIIPGSSPTNFTNYSGIHIVLSSDTVIWIVEGGYGSHVIKQAAGVKSYLAVEPVLNPLGILNPYQPGVQPNYVSSMIQVDDGRIYLLGPNWIAKLDPDTMTMSTITETPGFGETPHFPVVDWPQRKMWWIGYGDDSVAKASWTNRIYAYDLDTETVVYDQPVPGGYQQSTSHLFNYRGGVASNGDIYLTYMAGFGGGGVPASNGEYWHVVVVPATPV